MQVEIQVTPGSKPLKRPGLTEINFEYYSCHCMLQDHYAVIAKATVENKDDVIVINEAVTLSNVLLCYINYQLGRKVRITQLIKGVWE